MKRLLGALVGLLILTAAARAEPFDLPGLATDADAYAQSLLARTPAGGTPQTRRQAEARADEAIRKRDWPAAAAALEARIGAGDARPEQWLSLAQAQLRRSPPLAARALQAAWLNFQGVAGGTDEIPALLLMADALHALGRPGQATQALEAVVERDPTNPQFAKALADARRATGMLVRAVRAEPEADPPRACISFSVPPVRRDDFHAEDWVRLDPPLPAAAVTREADQLCVSGLPSGATTRLILRAGMPGVEGLSLLKETPLSIAMGNRRARIVLDTRMFVLPRGQAPNIGVSTINLSSLKLRLAVLSERNLVAFVHGVKLGEPVETYDADRIAEETGRVVWEGSAPVPGWQPNRPARITLPLPDALAAAPGLYALTLTAGDGTPGEAIAATQMILRTDLAPTVWRGSDGLTVQVRGYADVAPRAGVKLSLLAQNNDVLAQAQTDADGVARFAAPLLRGPGPLAPRALHLFGPDGDFTALDLDSASFDLSDRGVSGQPHPGPLDAFVWLDRGIYRPGETVQVMALLRDAAGAPADFPAHVTIRRPSGVVFADRIPPRGGDASVHLPVALSAGAAAGTWMVEIRADPAGPVLGSASFRVDAFVPDRMAVDLGPVPGPIVPGTPWSLPVAARFLYGAPGAGLSGHGSVHLAIDPAPFPALAGYRIGLEDEAFAPQNQDVDLKDTDAQGRTSLDIRMTAAPDVTRALKAEISVSVDDPSGHASRATVSAPVRAPGPLLGIRPLFDGGAVDAGTEAGFDIVAVDPDGTPIPLAARLRLVSERPDWRIVVHGALARYETVWRDEPLETREVAIDPGAPLHVARRLDFGRYRIEVTQPGGLAAASLRFRAGWAGSDSPDVPDRVDVSADRATHAAGEVARIHIAPPFAGQATLLVLTDRVHALRTLAVPAEGTDVDVPVTADWGPGAYVAVHVFRAADPANARPGRAIGLTWVGVDPAARKLDLAIAAADRYPPRARAVIAVRTAPGAWITLAAVDEGILRLTGFPSPDPAPHFLGRRRLGLDIRDDWGRLIAPGDGQATALRQGGDEGSFALPDIPQKTVVLFTPPVQAGPDGVAQVPLDLPDFAGQVRLMAVGWSGARIGAADADILVRDPLVAEPLLPRFLAPGDEARLAVLLHNLDLPDGEAAAMVSVEGPLALAGPARLAANLAQGAQAVPATTLRATGAGRGVVHLSVTGPGGFTVQRDAAITVRPARGPTTLVAGAQLPPGDETRLAPPLDRFIAGTAAAFASFGGAVRYDPAGLVAALAGYPLNCLEQATSRGFPLAFIPGHDAALAAAVASVLDRQRFDGGFGLWSASSDAEPWLSLYATEFLLRARAAGAPVGEQALKEALKFVADAAGQTPDKPEDFARAAYQQYLLAFAGQGRPGAARVLAEQLASLPTPLARAQLGAALALAHDTPRAEAAFTAALAIPARRPWFADYGTPLRDQAAIALLMREAGVLPARLAALQASLPGANLDPAMLSTQEQAWLAAAGAALGRDGRPARIALDGRDLPPAAVATVALAGPATARNLDDRPVWQSVAATGVLRDPPPAARAGMRVSRFFYALDGGPIDLDHLKQNSVFMLVLDGRAEDGQDHRAMLLHGLPAGWEIAARVAAGTSTTQPWLGEISDTEAQPAADDRFAAVVALSPAKPGFHLAVRLRAVTPGSYELPGAELSDMYRPAVFARQAARRVTVLPLE